MTLSYDPVRLDNTGVDTIFTLSRSKVELDLRECTTSNFIFSFAGAQGFNIGSTTNTTLESTSGIIYRGARDDIKQFQIPIYIKSTDINERRTIIDKLDYICNTKAEPARLELGAKYHPKRYIDVFFESIDEVKHGENIFTWPQFGMTSTLKFSSSKPYWTYSVKETIYATGKWAGKPFIGSGTSLTELYLSKGSSVSKTLDVFNYGTVPTDMTWYIKGKCRHFKIENDQGQKVEWRGLLPSGNQLTLSTEDVNIVDINGHNHYAELDPSPIFFKIPTGWSKLKVLANSGIYPADVKGVFQARYRANMA